MRHRRASQHTQTVMRWPQNGAGDPAFRCTSYIVRCTMYICTCTMYIIYRATSSTLCTMYKGIAVHRTSPCPTLELYLSTSYEVPCTRVHSTRYDVHSTCTQRTSSMFTCTSTQVALRAGSLSQCIQSSTLPLALPCTTYIVLVLCTRTRYYVPMSLLACTMYVHLCT